MVRFGRRLTAALPLALLLTAGGFGGVAEAAPTVTCGAVLKADATLTRNLSCPAGDGITLYRGVVLNLGGFTLAGPGSGTAVTLSAKGGSVVKNGAVVNWGRGVTANSEDFFPAPAATVSGVRFDRAPADFALATVSITGSTFTSSPVTDFQGDLRFTATRLVKSQISGLYSRIALTGATVVGGGVDDAASQGVSIDRSTLDGTGSTGAPATCSETGLTISNSTVKNYSRPVTGYRCTVTLTNNRFSAMPGGVLGEVTAGSIAGDVPTTLTGNTFTTSGIAVSSGAMTVTGNTFTGNVTGLIATDPAHTTLSGNTFTGNSSSGVRAYAAGLGLAGNTAVANGRYGIHAPGALDLGGNRAAGNPLGDCVGLSCAAG